MRNQFLSLICWGLLVGCGRGTPDNDDHQRAAETATDKRPRGGSMQGAGGAGPGYDGSGRGGGKYGTVPAPGSGVGAGMTTNTNALPSAPPSRLAP